MFFQHYHFYVEVNICLKFPVRQPQLPSSLFIWVSIKGVVRGVPVHLHGLRLSKQCEIRPSPSKSFPATCCPSFNLLLLSTAFSKLPYFLIKMVHFLSVNIWDHKMCKSLHSVFTWILHPNVVRVGVVFASVYIQIKTVHLNPILLSISSIYLKTVVH